MRRRIIFGIILVLVLVSAARLVRMRKSQLGSQRVSSVAMVPVKTGLVRLGDFSGERICYGVISSDRQVLIKARTGGQVSEILAREGDPVRQGDALLELDGTAAAPLANRAAITTAIGNLNRSVESLRITRRNLKSILDNDRMLRENDAISTQQVEMSENRYEEAGVQLATLRSELAAQKVQLTLFTIRSPFDGLVGKVIVQLGEIAAPNQPLMSVEDSSPCKITATVAARDLPRIHPEGAVTLISEGLKQVATLSRIHPSTNASGNGSVDIILDNPPFGLPMGASTEVRLTVDVLSDVLIVPTNSVLEGVGQSRVHVVENDTVRVVPVIVSATSGNIMAVQGELTVDDVLVLGSDSLLMRMANGVRVAPQGEIR